MSKPGDFDRVDRPEDKGKGDRFQQFKADTAAQIRYREEYHVAAQAGVPLGDLPHPDAVGAKDVGEALVKLAVRRIAEKDRLKGVPGVDVKG